MLKLFKPYVSPESISNVIEVLQSTQLAEGPQVQLFEKELEETLNKENIITLNSGSAALELALELAGIGEGDEVITPVLTCTATNLPILHRKAKIVFADINHDLNINIEDVKQKITERTRAIIFVHFGGNNQGIEEISQLCRERNLILIEDAAQAIISENWGIGDYTCVSLQAIKSITSGDGGFLITKTKEDYQKAKRLRWFGIDREKKNLGIEVDVTEAGYKYHMNDIMAAIGRGNLEHFDKIKSHINELRDIYKSYGLFAHSWLAGGFTDDYEGLKKAMLDKGIEIGQHHYRNDMYEVFGGRQNLPVMDEVEKKYFFVPLHMGVTLEDAHLIGKTYELIQRS